MKLPDKESTVKFVKALIVVLGAAGVALTPEQQSHILIATGVIYSVLQVWQGVMKKKYGN